MTDAAAVLAGGPARSRWSPGRALVWLGWRLYPVVLIVGAWWFLASRGVLGNEFVMPPPATVWDRAREMIDDGSLLQQTRSTLGRVFLAYGLAVVVGVVIGTLIGRVRVFRWTVRPVVSFLFPTPKVALYPAMTIVFGLGAASKVAFGFAEALFPVLLATAAGTSQVEPRLVWSASALGSSPRASLLRIIVPAALPAILTGARIALVGSIVGVYLGEMIAGGDGLGHVMAVAYRTLRTPDMYVSIITISVTGYVLDRTFLMARRRLLSWSAEEER